MVVVFADGDPIEIIKVDIVNDWLMESAETFQVTLSNPTGGATISTAEAIGTIVDDDPEAAGPVIEPPVACDDTFDGDGVYLYIVAHGGRTCNAWWTARPGSGRITVKSTVDSIPD